MKQCIEGFASGRVQGVCYRQFTLEQALALGIDGWVKNLEDGRVAFLACAEKPLLDAFLERLQQGPERSRVDTLEYTSSENTPPVGFRIIR